jgi:hypothetical protein
MGLSLEDTQKKLDKALKRNLETQAQVQIQPEKTLDKQESASEEV